MIVAYMPVSAWQCHVPYVLFRRGINRTPEWSGHKWTFWSTAVNVPWMHCVPLLQTTFEPPGSHWRTAYSTDVLCIAGGCTHLPPMVSYYYQYATPEKTIHRYITSNYKQSLWKFGLITTHQGVCSLCLFSFLLPIIYSKWRTGSALLQPPGLKRQL